jgi:predicted HTH domain antitoxin
MGTVSARLPDDLERELDEYVEEENLERSVAVRKLLSEGLDDWKLERAVSLLEEGEISFSRAVELAETDVWSFSEYLEEKDVAWVEDAEEDLEAV